MKIKSLLLGSAAAMIAASAAQAADAIVVEPEPVEYVRVCDAYGSGYFYIPGTETCLKIGGYVRTTYSHKERTYNADHYVEKSDKLDGTKVAADVASEYVAGGKNEANDSSWGYRGRLNIEAKNETEYGTLASYLRVQGDGNGTADGNYAVDRALISLAGFRAGYSDTYYTTNHGYGAGNGAINDGYYNYDQGLFADYTFSMEGFAITGGVQQSHDATNTLDWYAGVNWKSDFATIAFTALNDNSNDDTAYKVSAIVPFADTGWQLGAWYAWDDGKTAYVTGGLDNSVNEQWAVWLGGNLTDNFDVYGLYNQANGDFDSATSAVVGSADATQWTLGANWQPVKGLNVQFEYSNETREGDFAADNVVNDESDQYQIRVVRSW